MTVIFYWCKIESRYIIHIFNVFGKRPPTYRKKTDKPPNTFSVARAGFEPMLLVGGPTSICRGSVLPNTWLRIHLLRFWPRYFPIRIQNDQNLFYMSCICGCCYPSSKAKCPILAYYWSKRESETWLAKMAVFMHPCTHLITTLDIMNGNMPNDTGCRSQVVVLSLSKR
jgi:hypothetical protein